MNKRKRVDFGKHSLERISQRSRDMLAKYNPRESGRKEIAGKLVYASKHKRDGEVYINLYTEGHRRYVVVELKNSFKVVTMTQLNSFSVESKLKKQEVIDVDEIRELMIL